MLLWLKENLATLLVAAVLILLVVLVVRKMIRDRKAGKSGCGCGCDHCAMHGNCHKSS